MEKDAWVTTVACPVHVPCIWWTHKQWEENVPGTAGSNMSYHEGELASLCPLNALEVARWELPPYKTVWTMSIFYNTSTIWPTWTGCSNLLELLRKQTYTGQEGPLLEVWKQYSPYLDNFPISMTRGNVLTRRIGAICWQSFSSCCSWLHCFWKDWRFHAFPWWEHGQVRFVTRSYTNRLKMTQLSQCFRNNKKFPF